MSSLPTLESHAGTDVTLRWIASENGSSAGKSAHTQRCPSEYLKQSSAWSEIIEVFEDGVGTSEMAISPSSLFDLLADPESHRRERK